jgi:hypothetical protein
MRRNPSSLVAAAACALMASCASDPVAPSAALHFRPMARSALVSSRDVNFLVAQWQKDAESTTVLARQQGGGTPHPVARLVQVSQGPRQLVSVQLLPEYASAAVRADHQIAALEQLYAMVLRQEPDARYCLGSGEHACSPDRDRVSHAQVLLALARQRKELTDHISVAVPWRSVEMMGAARSWDADMVAVRATADRVPLEGVVIHFNRQPHSLCVARTNADGVAACRLVDQHGDEHEHDHSAPVVATFPGDLRTHQVLLPTTSVMRTPAFATRIPHVPPSPP